MIEYFFYIVIKRKGKKMTIIKINKNKNKNKKEEEEEEDNTMQVYQALCLGFFLFYSIVNVNYRIFSKSKCNVLENIHATIV